MEKTTEGDWIVRQMFSEVDLQMSPEEYAARHGQKWGCFSYHRYRYRDPELGAWVRRLGEILFDDRELQQCRQRFLTPVEQAKVQKQASEDF